MNRYSIHQLVDAHYDHAIEYGHGRFEQRTAYVCRDLPWIEGVEQWQDLQVLLMIEAKRTIGSATKVERRYYISSHPDATAQQFNTFVRSHWSHRGAV